MIHQTHAYHMVKTSPWQLTGALSAQLTTSGLVMWFHFNSPLLLSLGLLTYPSYMSMMSYYLSKHIPSPPHTNRPKSPPM